MNAALKFFLISLFSIYSALSLCSCIEVANEPIILVIPEKGNFAQLSTEHFQTLLSAHKNHLTTIGITANNAECWYAIANEYRHTYEREEALLFAKKVYLSLTQSDCYSNSNMKSMAWRCLSKLYMRNKVLQEALHSAQKALETGLLTPSYGQTMCTMGDLHRLGLHDATTGCHYYRKVLAWCKVNNDRIANVRALIGLGNARFTNRQHRNNADWYLEALRVLGPDGDRKLQAQALIGLGNARFTNQQHRNDADWYLEALRVLGPDGDRKLQAKALIGLGNTRFTNQQHRNNADWYLEALRVLGPDGDRKLQAQALIGLGNARFTNQQHRNDADWYLEALRVLGPDGDRELQAQALVGLGNARFTNQQHRNNADWYLEALRVLGPDGDRKLRAQALIGLGNSHCSQRKHRMGLQYYRDALAIAPDGMRETITRSIARAQEFLKSSSEGRSNNHEKMKRGLL